MIVPALVAVAIVASIGPFARTPTRTVEWSSPVDARVSTGSTARSRRRGRSLLAVVTVVLAVVAAGPFPALAVAVAIAGWPSLRKVHRARSHRRLVEATIPDAIDMLILLIRAGMTPHQAIAMLSERGPAPIRPAVHDVRHRVSRGSPLADALCALPESLGPSAAIVADTLAMSERYGTPIGKALEQLGLDVRERRRRQAEADARRLPIRMAFPLVCCTLPSFVLLAIVPAVLAAMSSLDTGGI